LAQHAHPRRAESEFGLYVRRLINVSPFERMNFIQTPVDWTPADKSLLLRPSGGGFPGFPYTRRVHPHAP
jgi:hypothetical protein